jgi:hypothetical protein
MASDGEQKRLEDAAGPHGARTTELVGVDDIGLPSGIQPEDVKDLEQAQMDPAAASGGQGAQQSGGAPSAVMVGGGQDLSPGDEAAPGTVGSGDDVCPVCSGSGKNAGGGACPNCRGTGIITEGIGGG